MKHKRRKTDQNKINRKNIYELWDNFKKTNICATEIPKEEHPKKNICRNTGSKLSKTDEIFRTKIQ